jgi:hypothetical protein
VAKLLSEKFRDRAKQDRLAAEQASSPTGRRAFLGTAEQWDRLATQWEAWATPATGNQRVPE